MLNLERLTVEKSQNKKLKNEVKLQELYAVIMKLKKIEKAGLLRLYVLDNKLNCIHGVWIDNREVFPTPALLAI